MRTTSIGTFTAFVIITLAIGGPVHAEESTSLKLATAWFVGGATLDHAVTNQGLRNGLKESNPVWTFANNDPTTILVCSALVDIATLWLSHRAAAHHPRLAKTLLFGVGSVRLYAGVQGLRANQASVAIRH